MDNKSEEAEIVEIDLKIEKLHKKRNELLEEIERLQKRKESLHESIRKRNNELLAKRDWSAKTFPWYLKLLGIMKSQFKIDEFRPFQLQAMNATLAKENVILIMPTGGGKSLCYQLPALVDPGITIVVSPLVSLMEDQVFALKKIKYPAIMLSSSSTKDELTHALNSLKGIDKTVKLIYVTPERLANSKRFMNALQKCYEDKRLDRIAVDEVHCCSTWGHDFRQDYNYLGILKDMFSGVPILGLTATSTAKVTEDVQKMLNIEDCLVIKATFNRPNLYYEVVEKPATLKETVSLLEVWLNGKYRGQSGIIYTTTQKECEELKRELKKVNIRAGYYHAYLEPGARTSVYEGWMSGQIQVIVATIAFGMGIDKPDVRFVIHHAMSKSMENFYQESGRAGRDGQPADCILMYKLADVFKLSTMVFSQRTGLANLYGMLNYCLDPDTCRRSIIAKYFNEVWSPESCNHMCDHCRYKVTFMKDVDLTSSCRTLCSIIERAHKNDTKVTANKLIEAWFGRGDCKVQSPSEKCSFSKGMAENAVAFLLANGYLKEDFHYTPYSTISYIKKGDKSSRLINSNYSIIMRISSRNKTKEAERSDESPKSSDVDNIFKRKNTTEETEPSLKKTKKSLGNETALKRAEKSLSGSKAVKFEKC